MVALLVASLCAIARNIYITLTFVLTIQAEDNMGSRIYRNHHLPLPSLSLSLSLAVLLLKPAPNYVCILLELTEE
jgi:hypothetical protein